MSETEGTSVAPASFDPRAVAGADEVIVATYNVEALFDCEKDHEKQDHEYLPHGFYAWTEEKLARKLANIGRVIRTIADGRGPDILALNEVENRPIVLRLRDDALEDLGYKTVVHLDTECMYGLDNAILSRFDLVGEPRIHSVNDFRTEASRRARGILEATFDCTGSRSRSSSTIGLRGWAVRPRNASMSRDNSVNWSKRDSPRTRLRRSWSLATSMPP
jgi:hypothetical protein